MSVDLFQQWFEKKITREWRAIARPVTVTYKYTRQYGGRGEYAVVVLSAHSADEFSFSSKAVWKAEAYTEAVLDGLLSVLLSHRLSPILKGAFVLEEIGWHDIDSCQNAFYQAAKFGTRNLLKEAGYPD